MYFKCSKLFALLLLITPAIFIAMQKPGSGQFPNLNSAHREQVLLVLVNLQQVMAQKNYMIF